MSGIDQEWKRSNGGWAYLEWQHLLDRSPVTKAMNSTGFQYWSDHKPGWWRFSCGKQTARA